MTPERLAYFRECVRRTANIPPSLASELLAHIEGLEKSNGRLIQEAERLAGVAKAHLDSINEFGHADPEWTDGLYKRVESARAVLQEIDP